MLKQAKQEELKAKSGGGAVPSKGRKRASTGRPTGQLAGRPTGRPAVAPAGRKQPSGGKSVAAPLPKGMPSHRGPKIRHKKRVPPAAQPTQRTAVKRKPTNITMRQVTSHAQLLHSVVISCFIFPFFFHFPPIFFPFPPPFFPIFSPFCFHFSPIFPPFFSHFLLCLNNYVECCIHSMVVMSNNFIDIE